MATRTAAQNNKITNSKINKDYDDDPYIQAYREQLKTKNTAGGNADGKVQVKTTTGTPYRSAAEVAYVDSNTYKAVHPQYYDASGNTNAGSKRININTGSKPVTVEAGKKSTGKFSLPELSTGKLEYDPNTGMLAYTHKDKELTLTDVQNALKAAPKGTKMYATEIGRKYLEQQKNGVKDTTDYVSIEDYKALLKDYDEQVKEAQKEADRKKNLDAATIRKRLDEIDTQISTMYKEGGYNVGAKGQKKAVTESYQAKNDIINQLRMERKSLLTDLQYAEAVKTENTYKALANNADFVTKADEGKRLFESGAMLPEFEQLRKKEIEETGGTVNMDKAFNYWQGPELSKYTEDEKKTFYYLYATDKDEAEKYWQYINRKYAEEEEQRKIKETYDWAVSLGDNNIVPTAIAYGTGLIQGLDYIGDAMDYAAYGRIKPSFDLTDINETMQSAALANIDARFTIGDKEIDANGAVRFLYGTGLSILNSRTLVGALGKYASIPMALSSASSATKSALAKGATDQQAITIGFWNGVAEAAFEEISIEHLLNAPNYATATKKELIRFALEQAAVEASEEFNTTLANTIADAIVMGNLSDYNVSYNEYRAKGLTMEEARKKAQADWLNGIILDALGGFISGGVMGGVPTAFEIATRSGANQQLKQQAKYLVDTMAADEKSAENLQKVLDEGLNAEEGSKTKALADEIANKQKAGETVSKESYYALTESIIQDGNLEDIRSGMEYVQAITGESMDQEVNPASVAALDKVQSGQLLTDEEKATLDSDPVAQRYYEATTGREYKTGEAMTQERYNEVLGIKNEEKKTSPVEMGTADELREDYSEQYGKELAGLMANDILEGKQEIASFANSYNEVFELAKSGVPLENIQKAMKGSVLTPYQVQRAYTFGRGKRTLAQQQYQNNAGKARAKNPNAGRVTVKNGLSFDQLRTAYGRKFAEATGRKQSEAYKLWDQNIRAIQELAKILQYEIRLTDEGVETNKNGRRVFAGSNGQFGSAEPGVIEVSVTAGMVFEDDMGNLANHVMVQTLAHELVHAGRFWAKKDFDALQNLVFKYIDKNGGNLRDLIDEQMMIAKQNGNPISRDAAAEEVVAQAMTDMLLDERVVNDMAERLANENPSLIEKIVKAIDNFIARIKAFMKGNSYKEAQLAKIDVDGMLQYAEDLRKAFADMTVAASRNMQAAKGGENEADDLKFSQRDFSYNAFVNKPDMKLTETSPVPFDKKTIIDMAKKNAASIGKTNADGSTSVYVNDIGRNVVVTKDSLTHGLDRRIKQNASPTVKIGELLKNSILINYLNPKNENIGEAYVLISAIKDENNEIFPVEMIVNRYTNELVSIDSLHSINTKKSPAARYAPPLSTADYQTEISVAEFLDYVNRYFPDILPESVLRHYGYTERPDGAIGRSALYQQRDAEGRELSEGQAEYFKDTVLKDGEGRLIPVYHGTESEFYTFDLEKAGKNGRANGYGFYLTPNKTLAQHYGTRIIEAYANLTKPLSLEKKTISRGQFRKLVGDLVNHDVEKYKDDGLTWQDSFISNYVYTYDMTRQAAINETADMIYNSNDNDVDVVYELAIADGMNSSPNGAREFYDVLTPSTGYDGLINGDEIVVFNSNQIKSVDNRNPTENNDIRYLSRNVSEINADIEKNNEERLALQKEQTELRNQYNSLNNSEELEDIIKRMPKNSAGDDAIQKWVNEYKAWEDRTQFAKIKERLDAVSENLFKLNKQFDALYDEREETQERQDIEKSGLPEKEYFVKKAVSEYGYTPYFYDAGYILQNGNLLNFSGEKGKHYGSRGLDHRNIGSIFANTSDSSAMLRFMSYGNVRIMDETPGIDILKSAEPTKEQYAKIRNHIEHSRSREYYSVDFTDERGNTIGSLEYEGRVSANKVIADIKEFFETGKVPEQDSEMDINRFLYQQRDADYMAAVERGDMETAQRMVDEAAKEAMPNTKVVDENGNPMRVYHQSESEFNKFMKGTRDGLSGHGIYFSYQKGGLGRGRVVRSFYINVENPITREILYAQREKLQEPIINGKWTRYEGQIKQTALYDNSEFDGVMIRRDEVVVKNPSQIKSADPVTYDDDGNVIPLSERFNEGNEDIRYQLRGYSDKQIENWKDSKQIEIYKDDAQVIDFANKALSETDFKKKLYFGMVDEQLANRIKTITGLDVLGRNVALRADNVRHIIEKHGNSKTESKRGQIAVSVNDFTQIPDVIGNPDSISKDIYEKKPAITFKKQYTDRVITIFAVDSGSSLDVFVQTMYIGKKNRSIAYMPGGVSLGPTSETTVGTASANYNTPSSPVSQEGNNKKQYRSSSMPSDIDILIEASEDVRNNKAGNFSQKEINALNTVYDRLQKIKSLREKRAEYREKLNKAMAKENPDRVEVNDLSAYVRAYSSQITDQENYVLKLAGENVPATKSVLKTARQNAVSTAVQAEKAKSNALATALRKMRDEKVAEAEARGRERLREYRENRNESETKVAVRRRIQKKVNTLYDWMTTNSKDKHIPDVIKSSVGELLESIDFTTTGETKKDKAFAEKMARLAAVLERQAAYMSDPEKNEGLTDFYLDMPNGFAEEVRDLSDTISKAALMNDGWSVMSLNSAELKNLDDILRVVTKSVREMNSLIMNGRFANAVDAADETINELGELSSYQGSSGNIEGFFAFENRTPVYAFEKIGKAASSMFKEIQKGWSKFAINISKVIDFAENTYTAKEANKWQKEIHDIELSSGKTIRMTTAQMMAFYCTSKREQGLNHLLGGGAKIADIIQDRKIGKKSIHQTEPYLLTIEDVQKINAELQKDERAVEVADKLQKYMADYGARLGNEITLARFGIRQFGEENYFPITSDMNNLIAVDPDAKENDIFRLLNISPTKGLVKGANNAIVIGDIFEVFSHHMEDMTKYNALALPILDMIKWYNFNEKEKLENGQIITRNTKKAIEQAYGLAGKRYVLNFIKDINGANNGGRGTGVISALVGNAKVAAVGANLRVALLQPTSYVRAAAVIPAKYMAKAKLYAPKEIATRAGWNEALKHSGLAKWKNLGYYDTNIGRRLSEQIMHTETAKDVIDDWTMKPAEFGDQITWGQIWIACKMEQQDKGYTGDELFEKTAERFDDVIVKTQVMDSTLTRSDIMRNKDGWAKTATAFLSEPTLSLNILLEQWDRVSEDMRKGLSARSAVLKNGNAIVKSTSAVVLGSVVSALAESLADAVRDDDDDEFIKKLQNALFGDPSYSGLKKFYDSNLGSDISIINKIPVLKGVVNEILGYGNSDMANTIFEDIIAAYKAIGSDSKTWYGKLYAVAQAFSSASGIPVSNAMRDAVAIYNTAVQALGYPELKFRKTEGKYQQLYYAMDKNSGANIKKEIQKLIDGGTEAKTIKSAITRTYKDEYIVSTEAQRAEIRKAMAATGIYKSVDDVIKICNGWTKK